MLAGGIPSACSTGTDSNKRQSNSLPPSAPFKRRLLERYFATELVLDEYTNSKSIFYPSNSSQFLDPQNHRDKSVPVELARGNLNELSSSTTKLDQQSMPSCSNTFPKPTSLNLTAESIFSQDTVKPLVPNSSLSSSSIQTVIFSWSKVTIEHLKHKRYFVCKTKPTCILHYASNDYNKINMANYAIRIFSSNLANLTLPRDKVKKRFIRGIEAIYSSIESLHFTHQPTYFLFSSPSNPNTYLTRLSARYTFYMLFTSISFSLQNNTNNKRVKKVFDRMALKILGRIPDRHFSRDEWLFLKKHLEEKGKRKRKGKKEKKSNIFHLYDIITISFIYNEMKFGESIEIRNLFDKIWNACKEKKMPCSLLQSFNQDVIVYCVGKEKRGQCSCIIEMRKLFQIQFKEILFERGNSLQELLFKYNQLKKDFSTIAIDFRVGMFNKNDFDQLILALERLGKSVKEDENYSISDIKMFMGELNMFISFKLLLYSFDSLKYGCVKDEFIQQFQSIKKAYMQVFLLFLDRGIKIQSRFYFTLDSYKYFVEEIIGRFMQSPSTNSTIEIFYGKSAVNPKFNLINYFDIHLGYLPIDNGRFYYSNFIGQLKNGIEDDQFIQKVFTSEDYLPIRKLWVNQSEGYENWSVEERRTFLKLFLAFLIQHNQ